MRGTVERLTCGDGFGPTHNQTTNKLKTTAGNRVRGVAIGRLAED